MNRRWTNFRPRATTKTTAGATESSGRTSTKATAWSATEPTTLERLKNSARRCAASASTLLPPELPGDPLEAVEELVPEEEVYWSWLSSQVPIGAPLELLRGLLAAQLDYFNFLFGI